MDRGSPFVEGLRYKLVNVTTEEISFLRPLSSWGFFPPFPSSPSPRKVVAHTAMEKAYEGRSAGPLADDDTVIISQMSEQTTVSLPISQESPQFGVPLVPREARCQTRKKKPVAREVVDEDHLCTLVAAYNVHFEKYSEGRSQVTQLIPSIVWKATYASYKEAYPQSVFKQDSLKERLREILKEIKTGNSNDDNAEKVALQCNSVMQKLRCTDGHAKRNVLRKRQKILEATADRLDGSAEGVGESDPTSPLPSSPVSGDAMPATPVKLKTQSSTGKENVGITKAAMLHKQSSSIEKLCRTFEKSTSKRGALVDIKILSNYEKQKKHRIANLKSALNDGVISDYDFKAALAETDPKLILFQDEYLERALKTFIEPGEEEGLPVDWRGLEKFMKPWKATLMAVKL